MSKAGTLTTTTTQLWELFGTDVLQTLSQIHCPLFAGISIQRFHRKYRNMFVHLICLITSQLFTHSNFQTRRPAASNDWISRINYIICAVIPASCESLFPGRGYIGKFKEIYGQMTQPRMYWHVLGRKILRVHWHWLANWWRKVGNIIWHWMGWGRLYFYSIGNWINL